MSKLVGPLMKVILPSTKNVLAPLGITRTASVIRAAIEQKIHVSGTKKLTISDK